MSAHLDELEALLGALQTERAAVAAALRNAATGLRGFGLFAIRPALGSGEQFVQRRAQLCDQLLALRAAAPSAASTAAAAPPIAANPSADDLIDDHPRSGRANEAGAEQSNPLPAPGRESDVEACDLRSASLAELQSRLEVERKFAAARGIMARLSSLEPTSSAAPAVVEQLRNGIAAIAARWAAESTAGEFPAALEADCGAESGAQSLLTLVQEASGLDDVAWETHVGRVRKQFGADVAVAASRGRLRLGSDAAGGPPPSPR